MLVSILVDYSPRGVTQPDARGFDVLLNTALRQVNGTHYLSLSHSGGTSINTGRKGIFCPHPPPQYRQGDLLPVRLIMFLPTELAV